MVIKAEAQKPAFCQGIYTLSDKVSQALSKHTLVNDEFETVQKSGWKWVLLCVLKTLLRPLYALLGKDPYSYVRVNNVAASVLKYCELNKNYVDLALQVEIVNIILNPLNEKTKGKYAAPIKEATAKIDQFVKANLAAEKAEEAAKKKAFEYAKAKIAEETKKKQADLEAKAKAEVEKLKKQFADEEAAEKAKKEAEKAHAEAKVKQSILESMMKKFNVKDAVKDPSGYAKAQEEAAKILQSIIV